MEIKASYFTALFALVYFGVGMFIIYFFRKRYSGRFGGQGYKFPAIIYFISIPIIITIGTDFFSNYDAAAIYDFTPSLDLQFTIGIFMFAVIPTLIYLGIGIYILSLEHLKGKKGYKGPAIIYFISVPTLIIIIITIHFMMNYTTGRFEAKNKPAGYGLYRLLVLKDIIPRSDTSLNETKTTQTIERTDNNEITIYPSTSTDEKYYALIIGNNNYQYLEKLDAAENDAKVLADVLENNYGFEVTLLLNADYDTTVNSMYAISRKLTKEDNLLIFYAGHGELDKKENKGYWLPVDASYEKRSKWISNSFVSDQAKATDAKHVLLIVDSCFSGSLMRSVTKTKIYSNEELDDEKYIKNLLKKKTRLVISSGGNEPVMDNDGGEHSYFALKLIETLKNNKGVLNTQIIFENIRKYVVSNTDQTPERKVLHKTGDDGGDFLFFSNLN